MTHDMREINFDGLIGPTHNYAGLSFGNLAATSNAVAEARPRAAALQGLGKMRRLIQMGLTQGFLPPHDRPATGFLPLAVVGGIDPRPGERDVPESPLSSGPRQRGERTASNRLRGTA